jgi:hypothetical protein
VAAGVEVVDTAAMKPRKPRAEKPKQAEPREEPGATGGVRYIARRPLKIGSKKFKPGDPVPEAASWTRVEAWIRSGYIDEVEV